MVKVKLNDVRWPEDNKYIGGIYPAFKMEYCDGDWEYAIKVAEDKLLYVSVDMCEIVEEDVSALKVKVLKATIEQEEQYVGNIYEAFKMAYPYRTDYAVHVDKGLMFGFDPDCVEIVTAELAAVEEQTVEPTRKILLVEDGSVDVDELAEWCADNSIKLIVYRQGANKPEFLTY